MAGDWLKIEIATPEKPEVFAITAKMGWSDPAITIGKLFLFWRWWDQQTQNGHAPSVTNVTLFDTLTNSPGFAQALQDVGWLVVDDYGSRLPNFDRHNGQTAKHRALSAKRSAKYREQAKERDGERDGERDERHGERHGESVTKRREDINTLSSSKNSKVKSFIKPSIQEIRKEVAGRGNKIDPEQFFSFYESKGWKVGNQPMKNWKAAIITWEKRETGKAKGGGVTAGANSFQRAMDNRQQVIERLGK